MIPVMNVPQCLGWLATTCADLLVYGTGAADHPRGRSSGRADISGLAWIEFVVIGELPTESGYPHLLARSEEHTSELQSRQYLVCRLLLEKKKKTTDKSFT